MATRHENKLKFTVPVPTSSKNSRQLFVNKRGKQMNLPNKRAKQAKAQIRAAAYKVVEDHMRDSYGEQGTEFFGDEDDIAVKITHNVKAGTVDVEVWSIGPKPKGVTGRGRDIDNFASTMLDALNGVAYDDDRQVAWLHVERDYDE